MKTNAAFSLVEVSLALGVAGFCLLAVFGLLPVGLTNNQNSVQQTEAANLVSLVEADLRVSLKSAGSSSPASTVTRIYGIPLQSGTTTLYFNEDGTAVAKASGKYQLTCRIDSQAAVWTVWFSSSWPATAAPDQSTGRIEALTYMDSNQP